MSIYWHIIPVGDVKEHEASPACWCKPPLYDGVMNGVQSEVYCHAVYSLTEPRAIGGDENEIKH